MFQGFVTWTAFPEQVIGSDGEGLSYDCYFISWR